MKIAFFPLCWSERTWWRNDTFCYPITWQCEVKLSSCQSSGGLPRINEQDYPALRNSAGTSLHSDSGMFLLYLILNISQKKREHPSTDTLSALWKSETNNSLISFLISCTTGAHLQLIFFCIYLYLIVQLSILHRFLIELFNNIHRRFFTNYCSINQFRFHSNPLN